MYASVKIKYDTEALLKKAIVKYYNQNKELATRDRVIKNALQEYLKK
jgi:hypothetical protein